MESREKKDNMKPESPKRPTNDRNNKETPKRTMGIKSFQDINSKPKEEKLTPEQIKQKELEELKAQGKI